MSILDRNKAIIERYFYEVWNQGKLAILNELMSPDYINHSPGMPNPPPGPEGLKPIISSIRDAFPDLNYEIQNMVISEDQVAVYTIMYGTHKGNFFGLEPTGKTIEVPQMQIERIQDGKIIEHWRLTDELTMMRQLGQITE